MSAWINHVKATREANPGMSYKDAMSAASLTWCSHRKRNRNNTVGGGLFGLFERKHGHPILT